VVAGKELCANGVEVLVAKRGHGGGRPGGHTEPGSASRSARRYVTVRHGATRTVPIGQVIGFQNKQDRAWRSSQKITPRTPHRVGLGPDQPEGVLIGRGDDDACDDHIASGHVASSPHPDPPGSYRSLLPVPATLIRSEAGSDPPQGTREALPCLQPVPQAGGPQKKTDSNEASPSSLTAGRRGRMGGRGEQSVKGAGDSSPALGPVVKMPGTMAGRSSLRRGPPLRAGDSERL